MPVIAVRSMTAVAAVHKDVHQGACEEEQEWERAQDMRSVFANQQEARNCDEAQQDKSTARGPETWLGCFAVPVLGVIVH